jgi:hypothetical protein
LATLLPGQVEDGTEDARDPSAAELGRKGGEARAARREREEHRATRDREELERERKRIERQLAAMDKPAAG